MMGTLIDPMGPQPRCVGSPIFTSPWPVWIDNCPSSRNAALLPADHPGKEGDAASGASMHLSHLNNSCCRRFFPIVYSELRRHPHTQQTHTVTAPKDPETSACSSLISCPLLDPGRPSPPCRQPRALCRSLLCWRVCGAPASFTAATPGCSYSTQRPQHHTTPQPPNLAAVFTLGPEAGELVCQQRR